MGPPTIEWAGRRLVIPRRQTRALFYRLAASPHPVPREQLCFLFWPDTSEYDAHRNFSRLLTHLRRALPRSEILLVSDDQVWLDPQQVWSDTVVFKQLCTTSEFHQQAEALQQAVDLYRGPFLAGFSLVDNPEFETWITLERQSCEQLYLEALTTLIERQTAREAYHTAITYAHRYLVTDDLAEDIHRRLIELYAASGDRSAALRQFEHCTVILEREFGVSPLPETWAAYQAVLKGETLARAHPASPPRWTTLPSLDAPLVGRDEALQRLEQAYQSAQSGQGRLVLISGEPGIGKSRLMQEFASDWEDEATVIAGDSHEDERNLPYWPLAEALSPYWSFAPSADSLASKPGYSISTGHPVSG
ncbi:MAG: AAA family ATPase [Chloroflexi bacterium]|nr:AAA family ATPase [Chloroflexota bacterium]